MKPFETCRNGSGGQVWDLNEFVCGNGGFDIVRFVNVKISGVLPLSVVFSIY